jgi:hypothetical protein
MKPVRIKYYGLFWMTRRTYLIVTLAAVVFALGALLTVVVIVGDRMPPFSWPWGPVPANLAPGFRSWFYHHFWSILIVLCLLELVDILVTLRKFAEKEAEEEEFEEDSL